MLVETSPIIGWMLLEFLDMFFHNLHKIKYFPFFHLEFFMVEKRLVFSI